MSDIVLEISTEITPAPKIKVDGAEYTLLTFDHLSPNEEAEAGALFARHGILLEEASMEKDTRKGKIIQEAIRDARLRIICKLSNISYDTVSGWPIGAQIKLLDAIREITQRGEDDLSPEAPGAPEPPAE